MKKSLLAISIAMASAVSANAQTPLTTAVDFNVNTMEGEPFNLFSHLNAGKYVAIDFFAYWCGPCAQTAPLFKQSYEQFGCNTGDVHFIAIEGDGSDAQTLTFEQDAGVVGGAPTVSGLGGGGDAVHNSFGISALPTIILIAPNRQIVNQDIWPYSVNIMQNLLNGQGVQTKSCNSVGVEDMASAIEVVAFPNPSSERINLRFNLDGADRVTIEIYDIMGQRVKVVAQDGLQIGPNTLEILVDAMAIGHYTARISTSNVHIGQTRFSVMR